MNLTGKILGCAIITTAIFFAAKPVRAQILFTDNFNADSLGLSKTNITNWTTTSGNIDVIGQSAFYDIYPGNGRYLDLDGTNAGVPTINLQTKTTFFLAGGINYTVRFDIGKNGSALENLDVRLGGTTIGTVTDSLSYSSFVTKTFSYTPAANENVKLIFSHDGSDNRGFVIDNVTLSTVIPEPTSCLLLGLGLLSLATARFQRRSRP